MKKRILSVITALALCLTLLPAAALADANIPFSVTVDGSAATFGYNADKYTYEYTVTQDNASITVSGNTTDHRIIVNASDVTITLDSASMDLKDCNGSPIEIAADKSAMLVLKGENALTAYAAGPGILVNQGATLTIKADDSDNTARFNGKWCADGRLL